MAYHSFPWCGDAWVALDILTPSQKNIFQDVAQNRAKKWELCPINEGNNFRLFSTFQNNIIHVTGTNVPMSPVERMEETQCQKNY